MFIKYNFYHHSACMKNILKLHIYMYLYTHNEYKDLHVFVI